LLNKTPVYTTWNPWLKIKLGKSVNAFSSFSEFRFALDNLQPLKDMPTIIFNEQDEILPRRDIFLPTIKCDYDPFNDPEFNSLLVRNFHNMTSMAGVFKQSKVSDYFLETVEIYQPMLAVFMIVDGLSFIDILDNSVIPCFVDGVSITSEGMKRLVGNPHIAERLFEHGYSNRIGFSYWDRHNELADQLFKLFTKSQLKKVETFEQVLKWFKTAHLKERTYIQIIRAGLDEYSHSHRDRPPKEYLLNVIIKNISDLLHHLQNKGLPFVLFVTADHGILWDSDLTSDAVILEEGTAPVRYYRQEEHIPESLKEIGVWHSQDNTFSLPVTHYRRRLKSTEWGCHGGVSVAESFVPLLRKFG